MKAAILNPNEGWPIYADFPDAIAQNENEVVLLMKAAAIKHLDKSQAGGNHYSTKHDTSKAKIIGGDGVGMLENGTRVYAMGSAMIAQKAIADKNRIVPLPDGIDDVTAAALPNAVIGSAMGLRFKARIKPGETVLINGATGFTGKMAVQVAKYYGAKKIIVTGRNKRSLQDLLKIGADEIVSVQQEGDDFLAQLKKIHAATPIDIIIDYLWGRTAELILAALKGNGSFTHRTRFVSIGAMTGDSIQLSAENLRSVDLQLSGSGLGSWTQEQVRELFSNILPEMFRLAAQKKLVVDTVTTNIKDIGRIWDVDVPGGKRLVVII
jgi:NADPH:quinone reductase-like Zn-dependent oxidoreductase